MPPIPPMPGMPPIPGNAMLMMGYVRKRRYREIGSKDVLLGGLRRLSVFHKVTKVSRVTFGGRDALVRNKRTSAADVCEDQDETNVPA